MKNWTCSLTLLAGAAMMVGCGYRPYLNWQASPPATMVQGKVAIQMVPNKRPPKHGQVLMNRLGFQRNGWGIPFAINLPAAHETLDGDVARLVTEAAQAAGIGMTAVQDPGATAHLSVEINEFWCDGYPPVYKAGATLNVVFLDPHNNGVRMQMPVHAEDGGWDCRTAYRGVTRKLYAALQTAFTQAPVRAAAIGMAPAAPPPPPPPAPAQ